MTQPRVRRLSRDGTNRNRRGRRVAPWARGGSTMGCVTIASTTIEPSVGPMTAMGVVGVATMGVTGCVAS